MCSDHPNLYCLVWLFIYLYFSCALSSWQCASACGGYLPEFLGKTFWHFDCWLLEVNSKKMTTSFELLMLLFNHALLLLVILVAAAPSPWPPWQQFTPASLPSCLPTLLWWVLCRVVFLILLEVKNPLGWCVCVRRWVGGVLLTAGKGSFNLPHSEIRTVEHHLCFFFRTLYRFTIKSYVVEIRNWAHHDRQGLINGLYIGCVRPTIVNQVKGSEYKEENLRFKPFWRDSLFFWAECAKAYKNTTF